MTSKNIPETPPAAPAYLGKLADPQEHAPSPADVNVPQEIKAFVKAGHEYWKNTPKKWREVVLGTADAVTEVTKDARKFAKAMGLTFRVKPQANAGKLVYKVTDKFGSNGASS